MNFCYAQRAEIHRKCICLYIIVTHRELKWIELLLQFKGTLSVRRAICRMLDRSDIEISDIYMFLQ